MLRTISTLYGDITYFPQPGGFEGLRAILAATSGNAQVPSHNPSVGGSNPARPIAEARHMSSMR
jgi:hypothetical protein